MTAVPDDLVPPPDDPKAALEDELIAHAMEPYRTKLRPEELAGMHLFLRLFVKTHPAMQTMIARRLTDDAAVELRKAAASAVRPRSPDASPVVTEEQRPSGSTSRVAPKASGVVAKGPVPRGQRKGKKGG